MDLLLDALFIVDRDGYIQYVSSASYRIFGYRPEEMVGRPVLDFVHPEDQQRTADVVQEILQGDLKPHFENRYIRKDGSTAHIMWSARWSSDKQVRVALARDITERKRSDARQSAVYAISEAVHSADDLSSLFKAIHRIVDGLLATPNFTVALLDPRDGGMDVHDFSDGPTLESHSEPVVKKLCLELIHSGRSKLVQSHLLGVSLRSNDKIYGAALLHRNAGTDHFSEQDVELLEFLGEQIATAVERKRMHSQLEYMASYDQLTGLPNRHIVLDRIQNAIARESRRRGILAILFLDLDKFKEINDTYGHSTGDEVLALVAARMNECVRESDTVGRIGGDEFVVLLDTIKQKSDVIGIANKIRTALSAPYQLTSVTLHLTPSIGMAFYPEHGQDIETLISSADSEMYLDKQGRH
ncbi:Cyclic di-GMP phosphodiesterase Gmr [Marinobacter litoralis]|uniref:Cyclic di-GMP phosphodiesterase Gmr n=1 Tax=Marinobacter litoralis TaxID=187981 RepID=A0A3M2RM87_9GAMM|nr:sensor domain-containing diguanylate cyclase [Marinobacter litoralis]RMJ06387.1 Cyclic di-GMP phosphodiesterase Gmr [Marinobacter litoralis]